MRLFLWGDVMTGRSKGPMLLPILAIRYRERSPRWITGRRAGGATL